MAVASVVQEGKVVARRRSSQGRVDAWKAEVGDASDAVVIADEWLELPKDRPADLSTIRRERDKLLNLHRWTVMPDSPLSAKSQLEWLGYLKALHQVTVGLDDPAKVTWPIAPVGYEYFPPVVGGGKS